MASREEIVRRAQLLDAEPTSWRVLAAGGMGLGVGCLSIPFGAKVGIAAFGTAISGVVPIALVAGSIAALATMVATED